MLVLNTLTGIEFYVFLLEIVLIIISLMCLSVILQFKVKYLSIGWGLYTISRILDVLIKLKIIPAFKSLEIFDHVLEGLSIGFVAYGIYKTMTHIEKILGELKTIAYNDALTKLPNKRFFREQLKKLIIESGKRKRFAVLWIDLDEFKLINDTLGHKIGDYILKKFAERLKHGISKKDIIARVGGDKFTIVINDLRYIEDAEDIAVNIKELLSTPFYLRNKEVHTTCSIGIAIYPESGDNSEDLVRNAEIAMYVAKEKGRNNCRLYNKTMDSNILKKLEAKENIRIALKNREFVLHYQPKVDTMSNEVIGLEALVRWQHPSLGLIYPNEFIPIAEEIGLIKEVDKHILELACQQIKDWSHKGFTPINIAVNISAKLFNDKDFVRQLDTILSRTGIDPAFISVEITETAAMENVEYAYKILNGLKDKKIKISLDDFGTGYSSLSYLKIFPIDILKIDKFFIDGITKDKRDESLIEAAITMARALDVSVVAEGVETGKQLEFLKRVNCDEYQGYLFSKPLPVGKIEEKFLHKEKKVAAELG